MIAAIVKLTIDPSKAAAAAAAFTRDVLPLVRSAPGFLAGYWLEPTDGAGLGFLLFASEKLAVDATPPKTPWSAPGVQIHGVEFRRVAVAIDGDRPADTAG